MTKVTPITDKEIDLMALALKDMDAICISSGMAYVRKVQGITFQELDRRIKGASLKRYMQSSYPNIRPLHIVAAFSWITMVPMNSFYKGLKIKEAYRGMDEQSVDAMILCSNLPTEQFEIVVKHLYLSIDNKNKKSVDLLINQLNSQYGTLNSYSDKDFMAPEIIDINEFAKDYYYSVALALKNFRHENDLSVETIAKVLGLSSHMYAILEDPNTPKPFSMELGARLKLGFKLTDAVAFTKYMVQFPQFHTLRKIEHLRGAILIELLRHIEPSIKENHLEIMRNLAYAYKKLEKKNSL